MSTVRTAEMPFLHVNSHPLESRSTPRMDERVAANLRGKLDCLLFGKRSSLYTPSWSRWQPHVSQHQEKRQELPVSDLFSPSASSSPRHASIRCPRDNSTGRPNRDVFFQQTSSLLLLIKVTTSKKSLSSI